jgi:hypothetical protein
MAHTSVSDPHHHTQKMHAALTDLAKHMREDIDKVDEPKFRAMFETSAEVLTGLAKAFSDYDQKQEKAFSN